MSEKMVEPKRLVTDEEYRDKAKPAWAGDDEVRVDVMPTICRSGDDSGAWVQAWVWVSHPDS